MRRKPEKEARKRRKAAAEPAGGGKMEKNKKSTVRMPEKTRLETENLSIKLRKERAKTPKKWYNKNKRNRIFLRET